MYKDEPDPKKGFFRPLLIIVDRMADLHTPAYHSWTYLTLIEDIFGIKNNKFLYFEDAKAQPETYELDFGSDDLLRANAFKSFHEAAENVDAAMN